MNRITRLYIFFFVSFLLISCNAPGGNQNTFVLIKTTAGDIKIKLYDKTPIHKANFVKLVNMGFYDGITFHRVIKDFVIQAGDPVTRTGLSKEQLDTLSDYTIPAEFNREYYHKKGVIAAAREGNDINPEMRSSGTQFYFVEGKKYTLAELNAAEDKINANLKQILFSRFIREISDSARLSVTPVQESEIQEQASMKMFDYLTTKGDFKFSDEQKKTYMETGGIPRLDGTYTVFGEVIEGLEVVDKISEVQTNQDDKPLNDIRIIKMKVLVK